MKYYREEHYGNTIWIVDYDKMMYGAYFINQQKHMPVNGEFTRRDLFDSDIPLTEEEAFLEML